LIGDLDKPNPRLLTGQDPWPVNGHVAAVAALTAHFAMPYYHTEGWGFSTATEARPTATKKYVDSTNVRGYTQEEFARASLPIRGG
jgi:hypothetical protein